MPHIIAWHGKHVWIATVFGFIQFKKDAASFLKFEKKKTNV